MRKKLLLADDSITIQKVVELTFPSDEFEVVTAGNGRIAIEKAAAFMPDIVLCDVIMPQLDGYHVCEALRGMPGLEQVPILLLNGAFEPYDAEKARSVGALGNVSKPFDPPALVARVKEILAEHMAPAAHAPTQPMAVAEMMAAAQAMTAESAWPAAVDETAPAIVEPAEHEALSYSYDETETHPVSTVEVPFGVRELAARSLSLDAPVFAQQHEPFTTEPADLEPADFSETLHGPLDGEGAEVSTPMPVSEAAASDSSPAVEHPHHIEPIETVEEIEPMAVETAAAAPLQSPDITTVEPAGLDALEAPVEFDLDAPLEHEAPEVSAAPTPGPEPLSAPIAAVPPPDFTHEHEFEPDDVEPLESELAGLPDAPAETEAEEPRAVNTKHSLISEVIGLPAPLAEMGDAPSPEPPLRPARPPVPTVPATASVAVAGVLAFGDLKTLASTPSARPAPDTPPPPPAVHVAETAQTPAAEVPVPVDMVQQIAQRVISQVSERVIREIAWDVIPGLAEKLVRAEIERIKARVESEHD